VIPTVAPYTLPPLLPLLRQRYSALSLQIREAQTHTLVSELLEAKLDACLAALPLDHPDLEILPLRTDRFLLAVPTGSPLARQRRLTPEALQNHPLLLLEEGHCLRDQALAVCRLQPTQSAAMLGAASLTTLIQLVANGLGITLLPEICTQQALPPGVRLLHFRAPAPTRTLGLAWRRSSARKAEFTLLGQVLQEAWRTKAS
ncbi:MAG: hydrogen peroxide-inducible genes activator, partial [Alphaproteobacteria bacterium]|nr:hydrogen peroxide-inducible genes activator [Alphaproteobacteria bacterium]